MSLNSLTSMLCGTQDFKDLKMDVIGSWMDSEWLSHRTDQEMIKLMVSDACINRRVLRKFESTFEMEGGFHFVSSTVMDCPVITRVTNQSYHDDLTEETGAYVFRFVQPQTEQVVEVLVAGSHYTDQGWAIICLAALPLSFVPAWMDFERECDRLANAREPEKKVIVLGGRMAAFVPTTSLDEVILPAKLKSDIMDDVQAFFSKGVDVYKRLNLKPFRKLLLAGVPGTGKTMLCSAIARWALEQNYLVIYISSAVKPQGEDFAANFSKIQHALSIAARSKVPALVLLEELDAYLHANEKALVLNVLDGAEALINEKGTLLIATTNYPEAIDERVLKRPGRLDRIFVVPEMREREDAEKLLKRYLGDLWNDNHSALVPKLVGYPGAFIREVAVYALTQVAYVDGTELPLELLEQSFRSLKDQIDARDDLLKKRGGMGFGLAAPTTNGSGNY
jgi:hypothetical protein